MTAVGSWTVPPHLALWLPARQEATVTNRRRAAVRVLYLDAEVSATTAAAAVMNVPRFTRELLLHPVSSCPLCHSEPVDRALLTVLVDRLRRLPTAPLWLPRPTEARAVAFASLVDACPDATTVHLARRVGAGVRTLKRLFRAQTGMSLGAWRRRATILGSLDDLAAGSTVSVTAARAGYSAPSAYVASFRKELGETPRTFLPT